jgi:hypothetical protein
LSKDATDPPPPPSDSAGPLAWGVLALALLPAILAVAGVRHFATQDGPAHLYNAHVLQQALVLGADSPFASIYEVRWRPLPNWGGHAVLLGLLAAGVPPFVADKLLTGLTLVAVAAGVLWLRGRVAGTGGGVAAALWAALVGMNAAWLFGFAAFLLGVALLAVTLGVWWNGRHDLRPRRIAALAALLVLGYFAHLVSLGLTAVGLVVLCAVEPGPGALRRALGTLAAMLPLAPLGLLYRRLMRDGGGITPLWMHLRDLGSLAHWKAQLGWVDPISLASKTAAPFVERSHPALASLAPALWAALALGLLVGPSAWRVARSPFAAWRASPRRGWVVLAGLFALGGLLGPDTLGPRHGNYLAMRVLLVGLVAIAPALPLAGAWGRRAGRLGVGALGVAVAIQGAFVADYARRSDRLVGAMRAVAPEVGRGQRVGTLLLDLRQRFRANPLLHADNTLGVGTGNILWSNYETAHYYFPVGVRPGVSHPPAEDFERVSILDAPQARSERAALWAGLLARHAPEIDVLLVGGDDPEGLDPITDQYFEPVARRGAFRVLKRREAPGRVVMPSRPDGPIRPPPALWGRIGERG